MFNYLYFAKSRTVYLAVLRDLLYSLWWLIYYDVKVRKKKSCLLGASHLDTVCAAAVVCINPS